MMKKRMEMEEMKSKMMRFLSIVMVFSVMFCYSGLTAFADDGLESVQTGAHWSGHGGGSNDSYQGGHHKGERVNTGDSENRPDRGESGKSWHKRGDEPSGEPGGEPDATGTGNTSNLSAPQNETNDFYTIELEPNGKKYTDAGQEFNVIDSIGDNIKKWNLKYSSDIDEVVFIKLVFNNGESWAWDKDIDEPIGYSSFCVAAPQDWELDYEGSYLLTTEDPEEFNIIFSFSNPFISIQNDLMQAPDKGDLTLQKYVNKTNIIDWLENDSAYNCSVNDLIKGFNVYAVKGDGASIEGKTPIGMYHLNDNGKLEIDNLSNGWYAVEEILTEAGGQVFEQAPVMYILISNGLQTGVSAEFDYTAFYKIVNGYGQGYVLGYPGLNNSGDIFPIAVKNTDTGIVYPSFCYNSGSLAFAGQSGLDCEGYYAAKKADRNYAEYADFVKAYNYIEDNFEGGLLGNRAIAQMITWTLLGSIDVESELFFNMNWDIINSVRDYYKGSDAQSDMLKVLANYKSYQGNGRIVDIVVMECEKHHDYHNCQPQLVPIFGTKGSCDYGFNNTLLNEKPGTGTLIINKEVIGDEGYVPSEADTFYFKITGESGESVLFSLVKTENGWGTTTITGLAYGRYTVEEVDQVGFTVSYKVGEEATQTIVLGGRSEIVAVNVTNYALNEDGGDKKIVDRNHNRVRSGNTLGDDEQSQNIADNDVPLAVLPAEENLLIPDEDVPLGNIPQTGLDGVGASVGLLGLALMALVSAIASGKRREK